MNQSAAEPVSDAARGGTNGRAALVARFLCGKTGVCFVAALAASALVTVLDSLIPQLLRYMIDCLIGGAEPELPGPLLALTERLGGSVFLAGRFYYIALAVLGTALVSAFTGYLSRVWNSMGSEFYAESMRSSLYSHIQRLPFSWHSKNNTGDIIQRCTSDVETVRNFVSAQLVELVRVVFLVIVAAWMMFSIDARVAAVSCAFLPPVAFYSIYFHAKIGKRFLEADEAEGVLSTVAQENLTGVRVVRAFGRERAERDRFERANVRWADLWARLGRIMSLFWGISDVVACAQYLTVVLLCVKYAADGSITAGDCVAFISYNGMLSWPVRSLGRIVSEMSKAGVSIDRLEYILESEPENVSEPESPPAPLDLYGDIAFEHVSFSYSKPDDAGKAADAGSDVKPAVSDTDGAADDGALILDDVSFTIGGGQTLGVLGGTGSGKSTVAALLCRLYDVAPGCGAITIGGTDIRRVGLSRLRRGIGIVLQEPFLFSRTIRENIELAAPAADGGAEGVLSGLDADEAARIACFDETVKDCPEGWDTVVGERGVTLSGGQKQRAAIARTLMKRAPIVVFDDSLSAVDTETDAKIRERLHKSLRGVTTIIITHRVSSVANADKILVLDKGRVAQFGTHSELIADESGIYRRLWDIQTGVAAEETVKGGTA